MSNDTLQSRLEVYLELRRSLGYKTSVQEPTLRDFVDYLATHAQSGPIRAAAAVDWARQASARCYRTGAAIRLRMVRGFLVHLKAFEPETEIPPPGLVAEPSRPQAQLYSPEQIRRMMDAPHHGSGEPGSFQQITFRTVIGLLASTGLRIGEALRLTLDQAHLDHDPPYLEIRDTKFHKSRLVPLHPTAAAKLKEYLVKRQQLIQAQAGKPFFINDHGQPLRYHPVREAILQAQMHAGIVKEEGPGRQGPTLHALRHAFAVERLMAWYRDGADVRTQLPNLSVYLGHLGMVETYRYLSATPELLTIAGERFGRYAQEGGRE
ncbi:MAG: tyrosine-type recombinase/integrase [Bryobacterales bacterium]|nr:tyrosine-type recombinase/integrase [Bryobacterales bacterium]